MPDELYDQLVKLMATVRSAWNESAPTQPPTAWRDVGISDIEYGSRSAGPVQTVYADFTQVKPDGVIRVAGFEEDIELVRLRRTIGNVAKNLDHVRRFLLPEPGDKPTNRNSAANYLMRSLRGMEALAVLMKSDEVPSLFQDLADEPPAPDNEDEEKPN